jgi:wee1-like protein kinase
MRGAVTTEAMGSINQQQPRRRAKDISSYFVVPKARQASQGNADFLGSSRTPFNFSQGSSAGNQRFKGRLFFNGSAEQQSSQPSFVGSMNDFSQSQYSQDDGGYALCTPQDQPAIPQNVLRSPSPLPKKKSRHSCLSPHGLDDLRQAADAATDGGNRMNASGGSRNKLDFLSGPSGNPSNGNLMILENSNDGFGFGSMGISGSTPGASQDELVHLDDDNERNHHHPRKSSKAFFRQTHLNPMNKENIMNQGSGTFPPKAPGRRRRRTLPPCSKNPFLKEASGSRKRQRRPKMPLLDENEEIETSRYLEEFEEMEQLGSGEFCVTYKCRNRLDGGTYAIKRARRRIHGDADKRRMLREVFALSALADVQNVVPYHSAWIEDDRLYIQLGYCAGGNVQDAVLTSALVDEDARFATASRGHLTPHGALVILKQIGSGLAAMHERDMVHMDVKPDNILLPFKNAPNFCLGDLGMAAKRYSSKQDNKDEGDSRYLAKEMLSFSPPKDYAPADVFALGVSVYQLLRGLPEPPRDEYHGIREGRLCLSSDLPAGLTELLCSMVSEDPAGRPTAKQIVQQAESVLQGLASQCSNGTGMVDNDAASSATGVAKSEILELAHLQVASQGSNASSGDSGSANSSNTTAPFGTGSGGTMAGRGGEMLKAATQEIIEKLKAELQQERAARQKAEKMVLSLTSI